MTLPVTPPDRTLNQAHLIVDKERRRSSHHGRFEVEENDGFHDSAHLDSVAPVSVEAATGAALADLSPIDVVPLAVAIDHYREDV